MTEIEGRGGSPSLANSDYWWYVARKRLMAKVFADYLVGDEAILDVGSADGPSAFWDQSKTRVTPVDPDPRGLDRGGVCAALPDLPFRENTFDIVTAFDVVEHCHDEQAALREISRVLRPRGHLLMTVPAYEWAWSDHDVLNGHFRRYTRQRAIKAVRQAGFRVERATYAFATVFPLFAASRIGSRLRAGVSSTPRRAADIVTVPPTSPAVATTLTRLCRFDEWVLQRGELPFGSSIFIAASVDCSEESASTT